MEISIEEIENAEKLLLPAECHFDEYAIKILQCSESKEILACPGSGKTTLLLAKLSILCNHMPLKSNRGICVLSHTNVAVNEVKSKLGDMACKILSYPNYVGTIQSFIDKYIVFPYLTRFTQETIRVVDSKTYAKYVFEKCKLKKYSSFSYLVNSKVSIYNQFNDEVDYIESLYSDENGNLYCRGIVQKQAGNATKSTNQFIMIKQELLNEGIVKFIDSYYYAWDAIKEYGETLKQLLSNRFQYVLVDEYQDCDLLQCTVLDEIFNRDLSVVQKIGDIDQAIYNGGNDISCNWEVSTDAMYLCGSNRYSQEIADVLVKLRTNNEKIVSLCSRPNIPPILIIYESSKINKVIERYVDMINEYKLNEKVDNAIYKAIGMIKNGTGTTIENYWNDFKKNDNPTQDYILNDYVNIIQSAINDGNIGKVEKNIRKMIVQICNNLGMKYNSKSYTQYSIKDELLSSEKFDYQQEVLGISITNDKKLIRSKLMAFINQIIDNSNLSKLQEFFEDKDSTLVLHEKKSQNICCYKHTDIEFATAYKVKGETHTATLYLETETQKGSDLKRVLPLFSGKSIKGKPDIYEKSRKVIYVGFSRPTHLLCVAMKKETYKGNEAAFSSWRVEIL